jgi:hypothetical protein
VKFITYIVCDLSLLFWLLCSSLIFSLSLNLLSVSRFNYSLLNMSSSLFTIYIFNNLS